MHPMDWKDQDINIKHFSNIQFANFLKFLQFYGKQEIYYKKMSIGNHS